MAKGEWKRTTNLINGVAVVLAPNSRASWLRVTNSGFCERCFMEVQTMTETVSRAEDIRKTKLNNRDSNSKEINMTEMQDKSNIDDSFIAPMATSDELVFELYGGRAQDFYDFRPTRSELIAIAKHMAERAIDAEYFMFLTGQISRSDNCASSFGWARVARIRNLLGEEVDTAVEEVYEKFGAKQDKEAWEIYLHGSDAERAALQEEIQRNIGKPRWRLITKLRRRMLKFILRR